MCNEYKVRRINVRVHKLKDNYTKLMPPPPFVSTIATTIPIAHSRHSHSQLSSQFNPQATHQVESDIVSFKLVLESSHIEMLVVGNFKHVEHRMSINSLLLASSRVKCMQVLEQNLDFHNCKN